MADVAAAKQWSGAATKLAALRRAKGAQKQVRGMRQDKQEADAAAAAEAERARLALYAPVVSELSGLVLEVANWIAAPCCGALLADSGARVVKIEVRARRLALAIAVRTARHDASNA